MRRADYRVRWLRQLVGWTAAVMLLAAAAFAFDARAQGAPAPGLGGSGTVTTSSPLTGDGTPGSPVDCQDASASNPGCVSTGTQVFAGSKSFQDGPTFFREGTAGAPGIANNSEDNGDTGLLIGSDQVRISTAATTRFTLNTGSLTLTLAIRAPDGSISAPGYSFSSETNTGFRRVVGGLTAMTVQGVDSLYLSATGVVANKQVEMPFGGLLNTNSARPTCNSANRTKMWVTYGGAGVADVKEICLKDAADAYAWTAL